MVRKLLKIDFKKINKFYSAETIFIVALASVPLFFNFPYRVNIFLSWEGAYRLYLGQIPFKDFGIPMGYTFWVIPALFFKIFGPQLITLVKSQVLINIISGLSFRSILYSLKVNDGIRSMSVVVFCLSYSFFNFWPWYNHTVIVMELVSLSFLLRYLFPEGGKKAKIINIYLSAVFLFFAIFTKQDAGGLTLLVIGSILLTNVFFTKDYKSLLHYFIGFTIIALVIILPLLPFSFSYWFNFGQDPHNSRLSLIDFFVLIFGHSDWIKFYLFLILLLIINGLSANKSFISRKDVIFYILVLGVLFEAAIFQVTSYTPPDNNIFFHSFVLALILEKIPFNFSFSKMKILIPSILLIFLWWSGTYWKYIKRTIDRVAPELFIENTNDKISISTYTKGNGEEVNQPGMDKWEFLDLPGFKGIYMPEGTVNGVQRLVNNQFFKSTSNPKVLNMTELTPLALSLHYKPPKGGPLWYHEGVCLFENELKRYREELSNQYYDLVLFQEIPNLNNFFPDELNTFLNTHYTEIDSFIAPRRLQNSTIRVYVKRPELWEN